MYQVKNAMHCEVVSVRPDATVEEAIELLLNHNISGAPVIDHTGKLCGIISQFQLLEVMYDPQIKNGCVRDFMTRDVLTIEEDAMLGTAVNLFVVHRIRRLPVVRQNRVVGVISRSDLLRYFVNTGEQIDTFFANLKNASASSLEPATAL
jgi:predicted transcriptional regulator